MVFVPTRRNIFLRLERTKEVHFNLVVYGSSNSFDQSFTNPRALIALFTVEPMWQSNLS